MEKKQHEVHEKWFGFKIKVRYERKIKCSEEELVKQFINSHEHIVKLGREFRESTLQDIPKSTIAQHHQWLKFISEKGLQYPDLCDLILIMISIPPNSGWVERAYSYLEQICQKKRNRFCI